MLPSNYARSEKGGSANSITYKHVLVKLHSPIHNYGFIKITFHISPFYFNILLETDLTDECKIMSYCGDHISIVAASSCLKVNNLYDRYISFAILRRSIKFLEYLRITKNDSKINIGDSQSNSKTPNTGLMLGYVEIRRPV